MKIPTANPGISPVKVCIFRKINYMGQISRRKFSALAGSLAGGLLVSWMPFEMGRTRSVQDEKKLGVALVGPQQRKPLLCPPKL